MHWLFYFGAVLMAIPVFILVVCLIGWIAEILADVVLACMFIAGLLTLLIGLAITYWPNSNNLPESEFPGNSSLDLPPARIYCA